MVVRARSTSEVVRDDYFRFVLLTYTKREESCILGDPIPHKIPPHTLALLMTLGERKDWLCGRHLQAIAESHKQLSQKTILGSARALSSHNRHKKPPRSPDGLV